MTFTKLFSSITESTVWMEPANIRLVWITMLAMSDRLGRVWASVPGLAARARVPDEDCRKALKLFMEPDLDSRTKDNEGRRIEPIDGGWRLLNHAKYRAIRDKEAILESKRRYINKRRKRERDVENVERCRANAEAYTEAEYKSGRGKFPTKLKKFPSEALKVLPLIEADIQRLKDYGKRGPDGKLTGIDAENMSKLKAQRDQNKRIAYDA